ncbi:hypothetical protein B0A75_04585 [Flavobacterium oncorhynchi]|uniref:Uncharacterized protein n=1 Tax=Flavobacterium oncorhynchi TaxID=728056 RepID=A0A226I7U4_9FLAO|nr:hypothetical protein [Flavobacterium oncorhynchi]OXB01722.1 hypothetical protein B0A75_04585 [Flavobacterium oncorhynchi]
MSKEIATIEQIFESENLDANAIVITGIPERHIEAVKAIAKLFVATDYHNPTFKPDFTDYDQYKYSAYAEMGSPSGVGFSYCDYDYWITDSAVGSRLVSESRETAKMIFDEYQDLYKAFMVYDREVK